MKSSIEVTGRASIELKKLAKEVASQCIFCMKQPDLLDVAIVFVTEKEIKKLNNDFRSTDKVTDVLSFPSTEIKAGEILNINDSEYKYLLTSKNLIHFGDIAICTKRMREQSKEFGNSAFAECKKLLIHSMLHLMGYDHIRDEDYAVMQEKENELDKKIKV